MRMIDKMIDEKLRKGTDQSMFIMCIDESHLNR